MKKLLTPNICIAVYNEEKTIENSLSSLADSLDKLNFLSKPSIYVCLNGCTDKSEDKIKTLLSKINYSLIILKSERGKMNAHKKMIAAINNEKPVIFMDADIIVTPDAISKLISLLSNDPKVRIASGYPYVRLINLKNLYQKIVFPIINIKRIYPEIEICKYNVGKFHPDAKSYFERRSRLYFHGRFFIIRNKAVYEFPNKKSKIVGDDMFLSHLIINKYPPGSIKVIYDAKVYSYPQLSISEYLKTWYRILKDIDNFYLEYPQFIKNRKYFKMSINWRFFIKNLTLREKLNALLFSILRIFEGITYKVLRFNIDTNEIWRYNVKRSY